MNNQDLTGWYVAFAVGAVCLLVAIAVIAVMLDLVRTIGTSARDVALSLRDCRLNTDAIPEVAGINAMAESVTGHLVMLRRWLGDEEATTHES
jgi:hypothetical protein